jgi:hypothetical protein
MNYLSPTRILLAKSKRKAEQDEREQRVKEFGTIEAMKDGKGMLAAKRRNECL